MNTSGIQKSGRNVETTPQKIPRKNNKGVKQIMIHPFAYLVGRLYQPQITLATFDWLNNLFPSKRGIPSSIGINVVGESGTGKTQLLMALAAHYLLQQSVLPKKENVSSSSSKKAQHKHKLLWVDLARGFRPKRLEELLTQFASLKELDSNPTYYMDNLLILKPANWAELVSSLTTSLKNHIFGCIIIDGLTSLIYETNLPLKRMKLQVHRLCQQVAVYSIRKESFLCGSNRLYQVPELNIPPQQFMRRIIDPFFPIKITMSRVPQLKQQNSEFRQLTIDFWHYRISEVIISLKNFSKLQ